MMGLPLSRTCLQPSCCKLFSMTATQQAPSRTYRRWSMVLSLAALFLRQVRSTSDGQPLLCRQPDCRLLCYQRLVLTQTCGQRRQPPRRLLKLA